MAETPLLAQRLLAGQRQALAKCITLAESQHPKHRQQADAILAAISAQSGKALRLGISGPPGVGKSSLIEELGLHIINQGLKVAVLAIDPSSHFNHGSILGDKTRMEKLSAADKAFIRPSPTRGILGGVAQRTRESILLAEANGYDCIIVETVGVGQSEIDVSKVVDVFLMLQLPHAGDELQGIKKGILEYCDILAITKADGANTAAAEQAKAIYQAAYRMTVAHGSLSPEIMTTSILKPESIIPLWQEIVRCHEHKRQEGLLNTLRGRQNQQWLEEEVRIELDHYIGSLSSGNSALASIREQVAQDLLPGRLGAKQIIELIPKP